MPLGFAISSAGARSRKVGARFRASTRVLEHSGLVRGNQPSTLDVTYFAQGSRKVRARRAQANMAIFRHTPSHGAFNGAIRQNQRQEARYKAGPKHCYKLGCQKYRQAQGRARFAQGFAQAASVRYAPSTAFFETVICVSVRARLDISFLPDVSVRARQHVFAYTL